MLWKQDHFSKDCRGVNIVFGLHFCVYRKSVEKKIFLLFSWNRKMIFNCVCKNVQLILVWEINGKICVTGASSLLAAVRAQQGIANQQAGHSSIEGPAKVVKSESLDSSMLLLQPQVSVCKHKRIRIVSSFHFKMGYRQLHK